MNKEETKKYKNYPEGSGGRYSYDMYHLPFQEYLNKYYLNSDLTYWNHINQKFIIPLFDSTSWDDYLLFLHKAKPNFVPKKDKIEFLNEKLKNDIRFNAELKCFFSFLYSIGFFGNLTFEEWINVGYWAHPWNTENRGMSILQILSHDNSLNYLKERLSQLSIF